MSGKTLSAREALSLEYGSSRNFMTPDRIRIGKLDRSTVYELASGAGFALGTMLYGVSIVRVVDHETGQTERDFDASCVFETREEAESYIYALATGEEV